MKYISKEKVLACHNKVDCAGHLVTHLRAATNLNVDYKKLPCSMRLRKIILRMQFGAKDFFHLQREVSYIIVTGSPHFETFNTNYDEQKHNFFFLQDGSPFTMHPLWTSLPHLTGSGCQLLKSSLLIWCIKTLETFCLSFESSL